MEYRLKKRFSAEDGRNDINTPIRKPRLKERFLVKVFTEGKKVV